jgi:adenosylmethionine-8-amino-7-oxononanoate aminotransferase
VAGASLDLLLESGWRKRVCGVEKQLRDELGPLVDRPQVADVRVLGAIGVVEMRQPVEMAAAQKRFVQRGVWIRPFGRLVYLMPPYVIEPEQLSALTSAIADLVENTPAL